MPKRSGALPDEFPQRDKLAAGGIESYEQLDAATDEELRAVEGVGKAALTAIRAYGAGPEVEAARIESGQVEAVHARVNRNKYFRHGQEYGRGDVLIVPRYVLDAQEERGENPPHLVEITASEYEEERG